MHGPGESILNSISRPATAEADCLLVVCCEELEHLLRSGQTARAEAYFCEHPALADDPEAALDLIYTEYAARRELGEKPQPEEYYDRFPRWRELLGRQFQLENLLDNPRTVANPDGDASADAAPPLISSRDRFRVLGLIARGGIGQVMRATDNELRREVAIKELQPARADSDDVRERFLREAEITGKLEHPGVVPVYGLGRDASGRPFYAMRLVHGQSLQEASEEFHRRPADSRRYQGLEFQKLLRRFLHVCQTVAYAHSRGVIHRDLKPENVLLGPFGETLVMDWGLAKVHSAAQSSPAVEDLSLEQHGSPGALVAHLSSTLTRDAGEWIGTPAYMSPEQALGQANRVGPAGDVYSLGATLFMLLTGRAPLTGVSIAETLRRVVSGEIPRPRDLVCAAPRTLEAICLKAMALRPEDRYASPGELADDLERWLADEPVTALRDTLFARIARWGRRNRTRVTVAAIALVIVTVVLLWAAILINGERLRADGEQIRADRERIEANRRTARLAFDRGYALTESQEYAAALLWFARALSHAPRDDEAMRRVILTNMDAARHHLLRRRMLFSHEANPACAVMSADGRQLATADYDRVARLWDINSGQVLAKRKLAGRTKAAHVGGDGTAVFATAAGRTIVLETLCEAKTAVGSPTTIDNIEDVESGVFSPDGSLLATGAQAAWGPVKARLWRRSTGELVSEFSHPHTVRDIVFRPNHEALATTSGDGLMRLWQIGSAKPLWELKLETGSVERVAFTPDGKRILLGDTEGFVWCYDVETRRRLFEVARESGSVIAVACADDGQTIAAVWSNGTARTGILADRRPHWERLRIDRHTRILSFRPRSRQMLLASEPRTAALWDLPQPSQIAPSLAQSQLSAIAFSPDRKTVVAGCQNGTVVLRDSATGKSLRQAKNHQKCVPVVAFRPDGAVVLSASQDGTARLSNADTGQPRGQLMDHRVESVTVQVETAAFTRDGRYVLTGDNIGRIQIWDGDTGAHVRLLAKHGGAVRSLDISTTGDRVVAGYSIPDNCVRVWDIASGDLLWTFRHGNTVRSVRFSPDGALVISASNDLTARLFSAADGGQVCNPMPHRGEVFVAAFSPNGKLAVTGGYDAMVRLWEIPSGRPVGEPMRHEGIVFSADFGADGNLLLTGSLDRTARLWDVTTCLPLSPPLVHSGSVIQVRLHPEARVGYTGRLWKLPSPLPDQPGLIELWSKLATQRSFTAGDNIEWLGPAEVAAIAEEFQDHTGKAWELWGRDQ